MVPRKDHLTNEPRVRRSSAIRQPGPRADFCRMRSRLRELGRRFLGHEPVPRKRRAYRRRVRSLREPLLDSQRTANESHREALKLVKSAALSIACAAVSASHAGKVYRRRFVSTRLVATLLADGAPCFAICACPALVIKRDCSYISIHFSLEIAEISLPIASSGKSSGDSK